MIDFTDRNIGSEFEYNNKILIVKEVMFSNGCKDCELRTDCECFDYLKCSNENRFDNKEVIAILKQK